MDIQDFLQQNVGKWVSQRTIHHLVPNQSEGAKAELLLEWLDPTDAQVVQLAQGLDGVLGGLKTTWSNGISERNPKPQSGNSLLVLVGQGAQGQIISQSNGQSGSKPPLRGQYSLGKDEVLTLVTASDDLHAEERLWFASENFRLRTSVISRGGKTYLASFCSEIRMGKPQPPAQTESAVQSAAEVAN